MVSPEPSASALRTTRDSSRMRSRCIASRTEPSSWLRLTPLDEIPFVAVQIQKDYDHAVALVPGFFREHDPARAHVRVGPFEIIRVQEPSYAATRMLADAGLLLIGRRAREQDGGSGISSGSDQDPPLAVLAR